MATQTRSRWERARGGVIGFCVGLLLGAIGAALVYDDARGRLADLDAAGRRALEEERRASVETEAALLAARSTEALLRARVAAAQAVDEADRANYGLARDALRGVGIALSQVDPARAGIDPAAFAEVQALVETATRDVAPDARAFQVRLVEVEAAVDRLVTTELAG